MYFFKTNNKTEMKKMVLYEKKNIQGFPPTCHFNGFIFSQAQLLFGHVVTEDVGGLINRLQLIETCVLRLTLIQFEVISKTSAASVDNLFAGNQHMTSFTEMFVVCWLQNFYLGSKPDVINSISLISQFTLKKSHTLFTVT